MSAFKNTLTKYFETHRKFFMFNASTIYMGLVAGVLGCTFFLLFVCFKLQELNFIIAQLGVFVVSIVGASSISSTISRQLKFTLSASVFSGFMIGLGSALGGNYPISVLIIAILLLFVGFANNADNLINTFILFVANLFVIGTGLVANKHTAFSYGLYFIMGGIVFSIISCSGEYILNRYVLKNRQRKATVVSPHYKMFVFSKKNLHFTVQYVIAVVIAYSISFYFNLAQGFWLPMTTLLILKIDRDFSMARVNHRLYGTILGSILSVCILYFINNLIILSILILPIMFFIVISIVKHYGTYVFFLTSMITITYHLIHKNGLVVLEHRVLITIFACMLSFGFLHILHKIQKK